jgi:hypothetical protein
MRNDITVLVRLAAITVPAGRLPALAAGLAGTRTVAAALAKYDYGLIEPASRFVPPPGQGWGPSPRKKK